MNKRRNGYSLIEQPSLVLTSDKTFNWCMKKNFSQRWVLDVRCRLNGWLTLSFINSFQRLFEIFGFYQFSILIIYIHADLIVIYFEFAIVMGLY